MEFNSDHQQTVAFAIMRMSELKYCTQSVISKFNFMARNKKDFFGDAIAKTMIRETLDAVASTLVICLALFQSQLSLSL